MKCRMLFFAFILLVTVGWAQDKTQLPVQGEIALEGTITVVEGGKITLLAQSFTLPNGKTNPLPTPKVKIVVATEKTSISVRGDAARVLAWDDLKPNVSALVIGTDKGSGGDLPARSIQVWQGVKDGVYQWPTKATIIDPEPVIDLAGAPTVEKLFASTNQLPQGDFEGGEDEQLAPQWKIFGTVLPQIEKKGGNHWLTMEIPTEAAWSQVATSISLKPEWKTIRLSAQVKIENLKRGPIWSATPRLNWKLFDDQNKMVADGRGVNLFAETDWQRVGQTIILPKDAVRMEVTAGMQGATGRFSFDNLRLEANAPADLLPLREGLPEGTFSQVNEVNQPAGYRLWTDNDARVVNENDNPFLRLTNLFPNRMVGVSLDLALPRDWTGIKFRARLRLKNYQPGAQDWNNARIGLVPLDEFGGRVGQILVEPRLNADTDWTTIETTNVLPNGAVGLRIEPSLLGAKGILDVDDLQLENAAVSLPHFEIRPNMIEGTFEDLDEKGLPRGWKITPNGIGTVTSGTSNDNKFLRLNNPTPDKVLMAGAIFKFPADWRALKVSARLRGSNLQRKDTQTDWKTARVGITFIDARGDRVGGFPPSLSLMGDSDWKTLSTRLDIPRQAAYIKIEPLLQDTSGILDVDDVQFEKDIPKVIAAPIYEWTRAFPEGTFERKNEQGEVIGWDLDGRNVRIEQEEDNHFLRLTNDSNRNTVFAQSQWRVLPQWKTVRVRARIRAANLKTGGNPLDGARFQVLFSNADEQILMPLPPPIEVKKETDWADLQTLCPVPQGATVLKLMPTLSRTTGILDIDDVLIEPVD